MHVEHDRTTAPASPPDGGGRRRCGRELYDPSKNGSRCWCSMDVCGNRSKTRAYLCRVVDA
ncbi:CGNR zinc finger domain-containing protein [Catellatospora methionotrophica]|uniref:CGNR zinc finger domain-containing protein n=1 Tax=Catellatospora methionotrophica TaxID=121620 RepID=UPI0033ECD8AE